MTLEGLSPIGGLVFSKIKSALLVNPKRESSYIYLLSFEIDKQATLELRSSCILTTR